jgi:hypothetical protein
MKDHVVPITIYLAGYIYGRPDILEKCVEWRKKIVNHYDNWKGDHNYPIIWLDPLNTKDYEKISSDGTTADGINSNAIIHRDYNSVIRSDLIIANLNTFGMSRVPFGTISEMAWSYDHKIPIILISEDEVYRKHSFAKTFCSFIVNDVDELLQKKYINYFFKGWNSVIYEKEIK